MWIQKHTQDSSMPCTNLAARCSQQPTSHDATGWQGCANWLIVRHRFTYSRTSRPCSGLGSPYLKAQINSASKLVIGRAIRDEQEVIRARGRPQTSSLSHRTLAPRRKSPYAHAQERLFLVLRRRWRRFSHLAEMWHARASREDAKTVVKGKALRSTGSGIQICRPLSSTSSLDPRWIRTSAKQRVDHSVCEARSSLKPDEQ